MVALPGARFPLPAGERGGREGEVSDDAWRVLDRRAKRCSPPLHLTDDGLRRNYLNKVAINRQIVEEWLREASRRGLPLAPLTGALAGPGGGEAQFGRMLDIGLRLNARHETGDLARFVVNQVVELTGAERVVLWRVDGEGRRQPAGEFVVAGAPPALEIDVLLDGVSLKRQAQLHYAPPDAPELEQRSQLCVPLMAAGKLVGLILRDGRHLGRFSECDRDLLTVLANQAAVALENAAWAESLEQRVAERTATSRQPTPSWASAPPSWRSSAACRGPWLRSLTCRPSMTWSATRSATSLMRWSPSSPTTTSRGSSASAMRLREDQEFLL